MSILFRNTLFDDIFRKKQYLNWLSRKGQWQAKELNHGHPNTRQKELFKLSRNGMRKVSGLLTGHCPLKRHFTLMDVMNDPTCRGYHDEEETAEHILCECQAYSAYRFNILDGIFLSLGNCMTSLFVVC